MKPISEQKWWRLVKSGYNPPFITIYENKGIIHFCENSYSGEYIYSRITTHDNQYCVRTHKDEWSKQA